MRPTNSGRCPWQRALANVERAGLKRAAWTKATRSARDVLSMLALAL
jgi:hypothetical protein